MKTIQQFANDESGATAIEYGLIAALVGVAIIAALTDLGSWLSITFHVVGDAMGFAVVGG